MSEQPGQAAGTAKPFTDNAIVDHQKPWSISHSDPAVVVDANGGTVALAMGADSVLTAAHIVAAVNFCEFLTTEELDWFMQDRARKAAALRSTFDANSEQFHADQASALSPKRNFPGGLL